MKVFGTILGAIFVYLVLYFALFPLAIYMITQSLGLPFHYINSVLFSAGVHLLINLLRT